MNTLPKTWPFQPPKPLTEKQLRELAYKESEKAPF
jgi:hypothetical protein